jgi:biotin transporter BioY
VGYLFGYPLAEFLLGLPQEEIGNLKVVPKGKNHKYKSGFGIIY